MREIHITKMKLTKEETLEINYDEILTEEGQDPIINHITLVGGHKQRNQNQPIKK